MVGLLHAWVLFPLILATLSLGCGLLVEALAGTRLPGVLLLPVGFATMIVAAGLVTAISATAQFATPVVIALCVAGLLVGARGDRLPRGWTTACVLCVFAAYAAPVVLSGQATFAGYVKLDDTSTWLAMADHVLQHGRSVHLPPSTYERTLALNVGDSGYPVGSVLPLGIAAKLAGDNTAWVFQPYLAYQAVVLALCFQAMLARLVRPAPARAVAVFVGTLPALLYGYSLWGAVKELVAVPLIALLAVLVVRVIREGLTPRAVLPAAIAAAALLGALSVGGAVWLGLALLPALVLARTISIRAFLTGSAVFLAATAVLALPTITTASRFVGAARGELTSGDVLGNLIHPLSVLQVVGIWPVGDFRLRPHDMAATSVLIVVTLCAAAIGLALALRRRDGGLVVYVAVSLIGAAILALYAGPWVDAKVLAIASPALLLAAMAGAALLFEGGFRILAVVIGAAIVLGVGWSDVLAYRAVWLAPRDQLAELELIGKRFAGDGPAMINEYQPYGGRHFLRKLDPESSGELRYRLMPLRSGPFAQVPKGGYADIDEFQLPAVLVYPTLVLPRSPVGSRPPSVYSLAWRGRYYDVWQRPPDSPARILEHLSLGDASSPGGVPACPDVMRLARAAAAAHGNLLAASGAAPVVVDVAASPAVPFGVQREGVYRVWVDGPFAGALDVSVDGRSVGSRRHRLEHPGQYVPFGTVRLAPGRHIVTLRYGGRDWRPGSAATLYASVARIVLTEKTDDVPFETIAPSQAGDLCGRSLDWVEAVA